MKFFETTRGFWIAVSKIDIIDRDDEGNPYVVIGKNRRTYPIHEGTFQDLTNRKRPQPIVTLPPGWRFRWKDNGAVEEAIAVGYYDGTFSDEIQYVYTANSRNTAEEGELLAPGKE